MSINGVTASTVKAVNVVSGATLTSVEGIKGDHVAQGMCAGAVVTGAALTVLVGAKVGVGALVLGFFGGMVKGYKTEMAKQKALPEVTV